MSRVLPITLLASSLLLGCGGNSSSSRAPTNSTGSSTAPVTTSKPVTPPAPITTAVVAQFERVGFASIDRGTGSPRGFNLGAHEAQVATAADWPFFWSSHSQARLPTVDFAQETVVASFMGSIGGGSHHTEIVNTWRDLNSDDLQVLVREFRLGPWKPNTRNLTSPFHIVRCEAAVSGQGQLHVARQTLLDVETISAGSNSAIGANDPTYTGELEVLRDAAALTAFYARHDPSATPPLVDFQREMVVAVLGGYIPSFGNQVETLRLLHDARSDEIRAVFRVNPYRGGAAPPPAVESPFQILRVTRASGPIREEQRSAVTLSSLSSGTTPLYSGPAEQLLIRDPATFTQLWAQRIGGSAPRIDFTRVQVLAAFADPATRQVVSVAHAEAWEDDETAVRVHTQTFFGAPTTGASYSIVSMPRTTGPVRFEVRDTTPRP